MKKAMRYVLHNELPTNTNIKIFPEQNHSEARKSQETGSAF